MPSVRTCCLLDRDRAVHDSKPKVTHNSVTMMRTHFPGNWAYSNAWPLKTLKTFPPAAFKEVMDTRWIMGRSHAAGRGEEVWPEFDSSSGEARSGIHWRLAKTRKLTAQRGTRKRGSFVAPPPGFAAQTCTASSIPKEQRGAGGREQ